MLEYIRKLCCLNDSWSRCKINSQPPDRHIQHRVIWSMVCECLITNEIQPHEWSRLHHPKISPEWSHELRVNLYFQQAWYSSSAAERHPTIIIMKFDGAWKFCLISPLVDITTLKIITTQHISFKSQVGNLLFHRDGLKSVYDLICQKFKENIITCMNWEVWEYCCWNCVKQWSISADDWGVVEWFMFVLEIKNIYYYILFYYSVAKMIIS